MDVVLSIEKALDLCGKLLFTAVKRQPSHFTNETREALPISTSHTKRFGQKGEEIAARYLTEKGYVLIARNFRSPFGEVDIIAKDKDTIVFVEVRTCSKGRIHDPEETIGTVKQSRITRTAQAYLQTFHPEDPLSARFDVVAIQETQEGFEIRHITDAFECREE